MIAVTAPAVGTLTWSANGNFTYTPVAGMDGPLTFTYTVSDGTLTAEATTLITVRAPFGAIAAAKDSFTVDAGATLVRTAANGLFANDLGGREGRVREYDVGRYDIEGKGVLDIFEDGAITFAAEAGFAGVIDMFVDVVFEGDYGRGARLTLTVLDPLP